MITPIIIPENEIDRETRHLSQSVGGYEIFNLIEVGKMPTEKAKRMALRLNALNDLYFFIKVILRRRRLVEHLHRPLCFTLQSRELKELIEFPRDHFKTTICSEGSSMWRALPFGDEEETVLRTLGYTDTLISYLRKVHNKNIRTLIISEVITNATKIGTRIDNHYGGNDLFRNVFSDIIPDTSCSWTAQSMTHKRDKGSPNGEGTYDFIGVGGAIQSRHYDDIYEDDLIGKKGYDSPVILESTIEYHKLLTGAWDSDPDNPDRLGNSVVVNNRWAQSDLSSHIRETEPEYSITSHDAEGGCCEAHPEGKPIFPEEFSISKLKLIEKKEGPYLYSCQYRNRPINPETREFKDEWLRYYSLERMSMEDERTKLVHDIEGNIIIGDVLPSQLVRTMVVDPNHNGEKGRCKHAITVVGLDMRSGYKYLLAVWAKSCSYEEFIEEIFAHGERFKLDRFWLETVGAQKYLKYHIETLKNKRFMLVKELKQDRSYNAKHNRIRALVPMFFRREFWCRRDQTEFLNEYKTYPGCRTLDVLDTLSYQPQVWQVAKVNPVVSQLAARARNARRAVGVAG